MSVDMTYNFEQDSEPTDEQLDVIMREVAEDVRRGSEEIARQIAENIRAEYLRMSASPQTEAQP